MFEQSVLGMFAFATTFIALFIVIYSYMFLLKTIHHNERKPWEFLFIASVIFLLFEVTSLLAIYGVIEFVKIDIHFWSRMFEFIYSGLVLLAFISQHDLILKNHLILISKKDEIEQRVKEEVDKKLKEKNLFPSTPKKKHK